MLCISEKLKETRTCYALNDDMLKFTDHIYCMITRNVGLLNQKKYPSLHNLYAGNYADKYHKKKYYQAVKITIQLLNQIKKEIIVKTIRLY